MAATLPAATEPVASRRRRSRSSSAPGAARLSRTLDAALAVASFAAGLYLVSGYPLARIGVAVCFVAWTAFAAWRFSIALPALVALVPVVGLAFWTGWLTFEETDLLILASAAGGYGARAYQSRFDRGDGHGRATAASASLSIFSLVLLGLFLASTIVAFERGIVASGGWHFDFFGGYNGAQNGLRIFKSFVFALLLAPLVIGVLREPGGSDRLGTGFTAALALGGLAVLQERYAFTGLLSFSEDYRVTAPFWEMHTGGAALDGFLALTIPFAVREAVRAADPARFAAALAVLALAAYACLVTFSRGVYAAVPVAVVVVAVLLLRQRLSLDRRALWIMFAKGLVFALVAAAASVVVFRHGGYRALLALFVMLALAIPAENAMRRVSSTAAGVVAWTAAVVGAVFVAGIGWLVADVVPKGPYLVFAAATAAAGVAALLEERSPSRSASIAMIASWLWVAAAAVHVAGFWGGVMARHDAALVVGLLVIAMAAASRLRRSIWPAGRRERVVTITIAGLIFASITVFMAGAYMGGRFSSSRSDLALRLAHWEGGIARLHGVDWLLGKGLGRFPATSLYEAADGTSPGRADLVDRGGDRFLALAGTRAPNVSFEELFRIVQRVSVERATTYHAILRVRATPGAKLHLELCEQQLLYHGDCRMTEWNLGDAATWKDVDFRIDTGDIGGWRGVGTRSTFLAIANVDDGSTVDIRSVHLVGPDGRDVVANGDFSNGTARWFSTSNRFHLPWHIKNLVLDVLFDQGLIGVALFVLVVGGAWLRTTVGRAYRHPDAPYVAAAIAGYVVVGAFDSLLDVPRVAFLFYTVVIVGLALRNPRVPSAVASAPAVRPDPRPVDDAEARALRRQQAFGTRRSSS